MSKDKTKFNFPYFPFYANDFLAGVVEFNNLTAGIYIKLLCYQWINGSLPNNQDTLAKMTNETEALFQSAWAELAFKFVVDNNRLYNPRLKTIRDEILTKIDKCSKSGQKGAKTRWKDGERHSERHSERCGERGSHSDSDSDTDSDTDSESKKDKEIQPRVSNNDSGVNLNTPLKNTPAKAGTPQAEFIESWKALYKAKTGSEYKANTKDYVLVSSLLKNFSAAAVLEKAKLFFELCQHGDIWFAKSMADFTIGKLSVHWNSIIKEVKNNGKRTGVKQSEIDAFLSNRSD